jgi:ribosomal protein L15
MVAVTSFRLGRKTAKDKGSRCGRGAAGGGQMFAGDDRPEE